jgi:hypothetical protein
MRPAPLALRLMRIPRRLSLTLYACLAFTTLAVAHPGDRKTLVVRGRTIDAGGFPIPSRVWVDGLHKVSMVSDADGRFPRASIGSRRDPFQGRPSGGRAERKG